jgi:GNAT superfamily N-acetyltransferase
MDLRYADIELARRLERADMLGAVSYVRSRAILWPDNGSTTVPIGDGVAVFASGQSPINRVHDLGMNAPVIGADLVQAEDFYAARSVTTRVDLCPLADPSLRSVLFERGYRVLGFKHVWWRVLDENLPSRPIPATASIDIVGRPPAELWARTVDMSFSGAASLSEASLDIPLPTAYRPDTTCFLAQVDGQPAGGGALSIIEGTAVCFSTAVHPRYRRQGLHAALLCRRLEFARDAGCDIAMVQTLPGSASQRTVERLGFSLAYTKPTVER